LRVAAAGGLATDLVTGGEELIHWEAGGEGDERGGGEEDSGGMHFMGRLGGVVFLNELKNWKD